MGKALQISFDSDLLEEIAGNFDLREPNKQALRQLLFTLDGGYDPSVMQVLNLATGVGKTYLMAAFIEYLRRQGVGNVMIVTPGKTVQHKTVQNFTNGSPRYIPGAEMPPDVVTPQDYSQYVARLNAGQPFVLPTGAPILAFVFNIQQLIAPKNVEGDTHGNTQDATRRKPRKFDENAGVLFDYLKGLDDLVVIADESHLYGSSAVAFNAALKELDPAATIGLTASPATTDHVIYKYPLYQAIADRFVKSPVLAFRKNGYGTDQASEEQQLRDALQLRSIKQQHYDLYGLQHNKAHLNAVLFVVCQDTDHASQVAQLLRSPAFFDNEDAVLQVDSKHEDEQTQYRLENLDSEYSPVLAVVSVNKLKEGWDVKNIAVIVTLRAMASEVLTQQTMGRGLRLPFGRYTDVLQIDQLDIISHQSFTDLLKAENVLEQFGLEDAVHNADQGAMTEAIRRAVETATPVSPSIPNSQDAPQNSSVGSSSNLPGAHSVSPAPVWVAATPDSAGAPQPSSSPVPGVGVRVVDQDYEFGEQGELQVVTVERNPRFADVTYMFPCTTMTVHQPKIDLANLDVRRISQAASRVTSSGDVLFRKEIVVALGKKLKTRETEYAEVDSQHVDEADARDALVKVVSKNQLLPRNEETTIMIRDFLVARFMEHVTIDHWTIKALESASSELTTLLGEFVKETLRARTEETQIIARSMPRADSITLPLGEKIFDQIDDRSQFKRYLYYGDWIKSLYEAESFDSYSGEYALAKLLNTSPHIIWWHRLHSTDKAQIAYTPRDNYNPDFVALDDKGIHWIIEGKDARGRSDQIVQAKRKAAEAVVNKLIAHPDFRGQKWGYLIAYEDDVATSDSWDDLKSKAQPVTN
ncbi:DEAD/DEAH box helicase [Dermabacteraceae bacterium P7006]